MTRALVFPGQGSQFVGMGKSLADAEPAAKLVFEEVNDALSQDLSKIMWEGPEEDLRLTENTQPALMAVSMAVIRTLEAGGVKIEELASHVAGHSLGSIPLLPQLVLSIWRTLPVFSSYVDKLCSVLFLSAREQWRPSSDCLWKM